MRRSRFSRKNPRKLLLGLGLVVIAGGAIGWRQWQRSRVPFQDIRPLEMNAYLESPATLRGSVFTVKATVHQTLASSTDSGRLIVVMTMSPRDSKTPPEPLPVRVPPDLIDRMQTGRQFVFKLLVGDAGVLLVQDASEI